MRFSPRDSSGQVIGLRSCSVSQNDAAGREPAGRRHAENESTTQSAEVLPKHLAAWFMCFSPRDSSGQVIGLRSCSVSQNDAAGREPAGRRHAENESITKSTEAVPKHLAAWFMRFSPRDSSVLFVGLRSCSVSQNDAAAGRRERQSGIILQKMLKSNGKSGGIRKVIIIPYKFFFSKAVDMIKNLL